MKKLLQSILLKTNLVFWFLIFTVIAPNLLYAQAPPDPCPCDDCYWLQANHYDFINTTIPECPQNPGPARFSYYDEAATACVYEHVECNYIPVNDYSGLLAFLGVGLILLTKIGFGPFIAFTRKLFLKKTLIEG